VGTLASQQPLLIQDLACHLTCGWGLALKSMVT
jgi:hypothetical protein